MFEISNHKHVNNNISLNISLPVFTNTSFSDVLNYFYKYYSIFLHCAHTHVPTWQRPSVNLRPLSLLNRLLHKILRWTFDYSPNMYLLHHYTNTQFKIHISGFLVLFLLNVVSHSLSVTMITYLKFLNRTCRIYELPTFLPPLGYKHDKAFTHEACLIMTQKKKKSTTNGAGDITKNLNTYLCKKIIVFVLMKQLKCLITEFLFLHHWNITSLHFTQ